MEAEQEEGEEEQGKMEVLEREDDDLWDWDPPRPDSPLGKSKKNGRPKQGSVPGKRGSADSGGRGEARAGGISKRPAEEASSPARQVRELEGAALPDPSQAHLPPLVLTHEASGVTLQVPGSLNQHLRPYQREGVEFLFKQYAEGRGGVLADDMGLGKTVQTIAFIAAVIGGLRQRSAESFEPVLVVVPPSVIANWMREFDQWAHGLFKVVGIHGSSKERGLAAINHGEAQVAVTSYHTWLQLVGEQPEASGISYDILNIPWHMAVYDEAHMLKNNESKTYISARQIRTRLRYGLSGTIMSNCYEELWCLLDFMVPGCLGPWEHFYSYYPKVIKIGSRANASALQLEEKHHRQKALTSLVLKHLLRRTKDNTIKDQLPKKSDDIVLCKLSSAQARAYKRLLDSPDFKALLTASDPCECGSMEPRKQCCGRLVPDGVIWAQQHLCTCGNEFHPITNPEGCKRHRPEGCSNCPTCLLFPCVILLQKVCNHLELLKADPKRPGMEPRQLERDSLVAEMALGEDAKLLGGCCTDRNFMSSSDPRFCGKMTVLKLLLETWSTQGHNKVLLFSYSTRMLDILQNMIIRCGYSHDRLDGSTSQKQRQDRVDHFNHSDSCFVFLVSTRAGGLGLNLTGANKVVVFDPHWNPSYDLQAQDRAFRIGQKRNVNVYRLVALGTLEELVYHRQLYKQQQSDSVLMGSTERRYFTGVQPRKGRSSDFRDHKGELWGLENLLRMTADTIKTRDIMQVQQVADAQYLVTRYEADDEDIEETPLMEELVEVFSAADDMDMAELAERVNDALEKHREDQEGDPGRGAAADGRAGKDAEIHCLTQVAGVAHVFSHKSLLGGSKAEHALARRLVGDSAPAEGMLPSSLRNATSRGNGHTAAREAWGGQPGHLALAALAGWKGLTVEEMAKRLLDSSYDERQSLKSEYCASWEDTHPPLKSPGR